MATQDAIGIPFSLAHEQQGFRLIELPSELLDILAGPEPPVWVMPTISSRDAELLLNLVSLSIKSAEVPSSLDGSPAKPAHAVLCTPTKTYQLRHVQTSNSVLITQPFEHYPNGKEELRVPGISAIAACTATLELHLTTDSAVPYLKQALPIWHPTEAEVITPPSSQTTRSKHAIFDDIPLSPGECDAAWTHLCAFSHNGASFRPSARVRLQLWQALVSAAHAESIDLGSQFLMADLWKAIADKGYPQGLVEAVLRRLGPEEQDIASGWACIDASRCIAWVGTTMLEVQAELGTEVLTAQFLDAWRDSLPEAWRGGAELGAIQDVYVLLGATNITLKPELAGEPNASKADAGSKLAAGERKWHERFKKGRR
ncbi:hypothetical protein H2201_000481 [Coniosporium apollinis]|uniref:Sister chromatid cohesion protein Dcc1 n=1 Tax=Coniosporium apollinis TaxID=61459 RepID=A0ABQ9P4U5_9PEZI|nr:hypothetical protein H2201_000481 [Coniosporium apollinis]